MTTATAAPGPKLTRKGAQTRDRIVGAAAQVVFERGVAATTIDEVKALAKVSSSQLYHYFADRDALVRAVIERRAELIVSTQERADLSSIEGLRAWRTMVVDVVQQAHGQGGCPLGSLVGQLAEADPAALADLADGFDRWEQTIGRGLHAMRDRGLLPPATDPDALALALLAAAQGGLVLSQVRRDAAPLGTALDAMILLIELLTVDPA